jgi:hypothetical protein
MRTRLQAWRSSFYVALGLSAFACGGSTENSNDDTGSGGAGGAPTGECANPRPVLGLDGQETGFVRCDPGFVRRQERRDCPSIVPRPNPVKLTGDAGISCTRDQDCSGLPHGFCYVSSGGGCGSLGGSTCLPGCVRDEDCIAGSICACGDPVGTCVPATCTSDADCGPGLLCTADSPSECSGPYCFANFSCQKPADQCLSTAECGPNEICMTNVAGRVCKNLGVCGRPFLIDGEPRQAPLGTDDSGWTAEVLLSVGALDSEIRSALAEHWSNNGLMEHASVAAFARFTLELLALGAPAALVCDAQRALGDEIAHAQLCFGLASSYSGRTVQPGPLPIHGALDELAFADVVARAIAEACIGETIAAVEATEAREHAADPHVRAVLDRIARDERRHAELGFRFLRWVLSTASPKTHERLCLLASSLAEQERERPIEDGGPELLAHGVLSGELRREVRRAAVSELILPLLRALSLTPSEPLQVAV